MDLTTSDLILVDTVSEDIGCIWAITDTAEAVIPDVNAFVVEVMGALDGDIAGIESKDEVDDVTTVGIDIGRVLAPASHSLASSFSARRVTSANFAEIASTAVKLPPRIKASSTSDILQKQIC